ncbi:C6 zinc finger domain protein [Penicillium manginii]|uniref:C6 zinc finger domain protein n=1 Tax=Penicillium manginii TaxID=203109 RepID=UPI002548CB01|nr:C6 zinc finger domain protein [Penicillium manginii]KAJ5741510.1 C6 zinc finger domain protein [Penicillium manginii]
MYYTGCRTCRIRKVKCDEEKQSIQGQEEPHCKRCVVAGIRCEWRGGPIPRKSKPASSASATALDNGLANETTQGSKNASQMVRTPSMPHVQSAFTSRNAPLMPARDLSVVGNNKTVQAANSLTLSAFDRDCLGYLQNSTLVVMLGKHWPWSTVSYAYHKIGVKEPMVMSMILASTAREIHRSRLHDQEASSIPTLITENHELDGRMHYGRALSSLRHALKQDVISPQKIEAIFITLWLMIDYENRFGNGATAINIHIRGIESLLHNHVVPLLQAPEDDSQGQGTGGSATAAIISNGENTVRKRHVDIQPMPSDEVSTEKTSDAATSIPDSLQGLRCTSVPLFLLWTLYFFTPAALFFGPATTRLDTDIFQFFLEAQSESATQISLPELYRISRQSPARFWGDKYPLSAQLDDMENLPGLTLYHRSHVAQFKVTELFKQGVPNEVESGVETAYQKIVDEINTISMEYDTVLTTARAAPSCESIGDNRRVMETVYWSAITFYSTVVFFHLCFQDILNKYPATQARNNLISLQTAVSQVLELSLKLHRSRPRLMVRIAWPLFLAGIATPDQIYQDWVAIRLRELGRYGQNYTRISKRFDEIIQGGQAYVYNREDLALSSSHG